MSAAPQEQVIVDTLAAWLREIRQAAGYRTDAGLQVYVDESELPEQPQADLLLLLDQGSVAKGRGKWTLSLKVEGMAVLPEGDAPASLRRRARDLNADVRDALRRGRALSQLPAAATELRETKREIPRRTAGADFLTTSVELEVDYSDLYQEKSP